MIDYLTDLNQENCFQPVIPADFRFYNCSKVLGLINEGLVKHIDDNCDIFNSITIQIQMMIQTL